jgi:hypothetical protein
MNDMNKSLNNFFRMINDELTPEEQKEQKRLDYERSLKPKSNNPYCAFGGDIAGEEILSLDTH